MEISEAQKKVKEILADIEHPRIGSFIALTEEVGEVANEVMNLEIYQTEKDRSKLNKEIADVMFQLIDLANMYHINLEKEFIEKCEHINIRAVKWRIEQTDSMAKIRKKLD